MKISIIGTGYVGLVTGACLAEIGHFVTCVDIDAQKVEMMQSGRSPIYEAGLEKLMQKNIKMGKLSFTTDSRAGLNHADVIYIAVGTPQNPDGTTDLAAVEMAAELVAQHVVKDVIVVTKSTVPVGTNAWVKERIRQHVRGGISVEVVHNPEFLREGSAVYDTFHGDRIVIGADNHESAMIIEKINEPFDIPVFITDINNAEMIKYASNAFLATKISFINEIANICEKIGADVEEVAYGMGLDKRIGPQFLQAGIGYGGSCFPKDTSALVHLAGGVEHDFELLKSVIRVNNHQQAALVEKAKQRFGSLAGKRIAVLGLAYKPNTDDMREAASLTVIERLVEESATVIAYDPQAIEKAKPLLPRRVVFAGSLREALTGADAGFILTEWEEIKYFPLSDMKNLMNNPIIFDGRNCLQLEELRKHKIEYHSIGRPSIGRAFL
ncbi:UDP-glucose dehydrogenase family protein [Thalassobacillus devorans]|uniref:UDP-glucose dehydrogenase family protein n=1 Tax=Thalassobacillus devorans TaxID=279813 RepID=UPI0004BBC9F9|nr:UDP-glucose/GDP-mannose dehydrogenase family protein [Thalassobacillus devorans]